MSASSAVLQLASSRSPYLRASPISLNSARMRVHGLGPAASAERVAAQVAWQRLEASRDRGELIDRDLGVAPDRHVVGRGRRRQERRALLGLEVLAGQPLRAAVPLHPVFVEAPAASAGAGVLDRAQPLTAEAVVAHRRHGPLYPRLVLRVGR